jgi:prepilin-type N-terminal cleavage/methylation domain-containing protein
MVLPDTDLERATSPAISGRRLVRGVDGFTLIELLIVVVLIGITSAMFAVTFGATITRSSEVSSQNILQTEVRASLNSLVEDLRDASYGDSTFPITAYSNASISFYSPDRLAPNKLRKVRYFLDSDGKLKRQITLSTNSNGPPWTWPGSDSSPQTIVASIKAPAIPAQPGSPTSAWAAGQVFKYCAQNPLDLRPLADSDAPDPITWECTVPGTVTNIKTIVMRVAVSAVSTSKLYTYGAVATLRWNAS